MVPRSNPPKNAHPLPYTPRGTSRPPDPEPPRAVTAFEAALRIAFGGGIHAFLILLMPFSISDDVAPESVLAVLTAAYAVLLTVTTLPGLSAFLLERGRASGRRAPTLRATKAASSAVAALLYALLPASLMITEGPDAQIIAISLFAAVFGYLVHRACLAVTFSHAAGAVVRAAALAAPLLLILGIAWSV